MDELPGDQTANGLSPKKTRRLGGGLGRNGGQKGWRKRIRPISLKKERRGGPLGGKAGAARQTKSNA